MGILNFKGRVQANAWLSDLEDLNGRTDAVLGQVYSCIEEIKSESAGDFVDRLVETSADMADAAVEMMKAMDSLKSLVNDLIKLVADAIGEAVQAVVDSHNKMTNF